MTTLKKLIEKLVVIEQQYGNIPVVYDQLGVYLNQKYPLKNVKVVQPKTDPLVKLEV